MARSETFDYVIVGAGSAGCVLANRLTRGPGRARAAARGGAGRPPWTGGCTCRRRSPIRSRASATTGATRPSPSRTWTAGGSTARAAACSAARPRSTAWSMCAATPATTTAGRRRAAPAGTTPHVLPYFKRAETRARGADALSRRRRAAARRDRRLPQPAVQAFIEAGRQAGYPLTADMNGCQQEGFGADGHDHPPRPALERGARLSATRRWRRPNLTVRTGALTRGCASRAAARSASSYARRRARRERPRRARGDPGRRRDQLAAAADAVRHRRCRRARPRSASRWSPTCRASAAISRTTSRSTSSTPAPQPITLYAAQRPWNKAADRRSSGCCCERGIGATNQFEAGAFIRSRAGVEHPDLQYHFLPIAINYDGSNPQTTATASRRTSGRCARPRSAGSRLRSADPREPPSILFNYMATEGDRQEMRAAVRLTREIFAQRAFDPYRGPELAPGAEVASDAEIDAFVRAQGRERLPSLRHLQDGPGQRPDGGGRRRVPGPRRRGPARGRRLDHAEHPVRQPQRADDHARREGRRPDPRPGAARAARVPVYIAPDWETAQR